MDDWLIYVLRVEASNFPLESINVFKILAEFAYRVAVYFVFFLFLPVFLFNWVFDDIKVTDSQLDAYIRCFLTPHVQIVVSFTILTVTKTFYR